MILFPEPTSSKNHFEYLTQSIKSAKSISLNIRKFIKYQLTVNVTLIAYVLMGSYYFENPPMNAFQILWINLIMDSLAALSICDEAYPLKVIGNEHKQDITLISMAKSIVKQAVYQITVIWLIILQGEVMFNIPYTVVNSDIQDLPDLLA